MTRAGRAAADDAQSPSPAIGPGGGSGRKTSRTVQHSDESRQRILDATIEIASERGYEGTSISLVSERSGMPVGSIYWHFTNKDGLLAAVIERSYQQWRDSPAQAVPDPLPGWGPGGARVLASILSETLVGAPEFLRLGLMLALERRPVEAAARESFLSFRDESLERLVPIFTAAVADRGPAAAAQLGRRLSELTVAVADGLFIAHQIRPDSFDVRGVIDVYVTAIGALITDPPPPTGPPLPT